MATRRLSAEARRAQLIDVARGVFAEDGYHGSAMEQIAQSAGVTKPVLYQHFESKKELYLALLSQDMSKLLHQVEAAIEGITSNRDRIHRGIEAYFTFIDSSEGSFRLLFRETMGADPDFREVIDRFRDAIANRIGGTIAAETGYSSQESELLARGIIGMAEAAAQWWLDGREIDREKLVADLSDLAWRGLAGLPRRENQRGGNG